MQPADGHENIYQRNKRDQRILMGVSYSLGVNLGPPSVFRDSLRIYSFVLVVSGIYAMYGHWCFFYRNAESLTKITETVCTAFQTIISIVKMIFYFFFQRRFAVLLNRAFSHELLESSKIFKKKLAIEKELRAEIDGIMSKVWKQAQSQIFFYFCCCCLVCGNYCFSAIFLNWYHIMKATPNFHFVLPFPAYYPQWDDKGMVFPYFYLQWYFETVAIFLAGACAVSFDGLFVVLCLHGVGLLRSLEAMIAKCTSPLLQNSERIEYLRYCIKQYQTTYEYIAEIKNLYKHISLSQFLLSLIVLGIVLFQMALGLENDWAMMVRMIMYIIAAGSEIILYCYNGQELTNANDNISTAFYKCGWYNESKDFKLLLRMTILRTNRPIRLEVSWFTFMSLPTLISLFRTSGSYFLLLRNVAE